MFRLLLAIVGLLITAATLVGTALVAFSVWSTGDTAFGEGSWPQTMRTLAVAGLAWTPWVGAKLANPFVTFGDHLRATFAEWTAWGVIVLLAVVGTVIPTIVTGGWWPLALVTVSCFVWGLRSGVRAEGSVEIRQDGLP